jgi:signal transduction histidine kinase
VSDAGPVDSASSGSPAGPGARRPLKLFINLKWRSEIEPWLLALIIAGAYGLCAVLYLILSDVLAMLLTSSAEQLASVHAVKGLLFVLVTTGVAWLFAYAVFRWLALIQQVLIAQREQAVELEKRSYASLLAATIAHDINNGLLVARCNTQLLDNGNLFTEDQQLALRDLKHSLGDLATLARKLMSIDRPIERPKRESFDLAHVCNEVCETLRRHPRIGKRQVITECSQPVRITGDAQVWQRIVLNLVFNACEVVPADGTILVRCERMTKEAVLEVHDNGPGIAADLRGQIFEPYYTGTNGRGLGLASVQLSVAQHAGTIEVGESPLGGAAFTIRIPIES